LAEIWKEVAMAYTMYHQDICREGLRKIMKNNNKDSQYPGRDSNGKSFKYASMSKF
jgi:hypothetical protein